MEIKQHRKKTLMAYKKGYLVDYCMTLEHNLNSMKVNFEIQYKNCMQIVDDMNLLNKTYKEVNKQKI